MVKGRIRPGSIIVQDHRVFTWPRCAPPRSEYDGEEYQYLAKNHAMLFDVNVFSNGDEGTCGAMCTAPGYGDQHGCYGNGPILTRSVSCVEIIDNAES